MGTHGHRDCRGKSGEHVMSDPHETRACGLLDAKLDEALDYIATEFNVTSAAMIGMLVSKAHELLHADDEEE